MQILKVKTAGGLSMAACYPRTNPKDGFITRAAKSRMTSKAQKFINRKNQRSNLEFSLAANLRKGDWFIVLTYDDNHLPRSRADAEKCMVAFMRKLREAKAPRAYYYNTEGKHADPKPEENKRLHHHLYITADGYTVKSIEQLWGRGHVYGHKLRFSGELTYGALASYMIKEAEEHPGKRAWHCSRNLKKPDVQTFYVADDYVILPPDDPNVIVLENSGVNDTAYGRYQEIKTQTLDGYPQGEVESVYDIPAKRKRRKGRLQGTVLT